MPNWTQNELIIEAPHSELKAFIAKAENGLLNAMCPLGEDATMDDAIEQWGSKWEAQETALYYEDEELTATFITPWGSPFEAVTTLKKANPNWNIWMKYTDEDGPSGEWYNGEIEEYGTMFD